MLPAPAEADELLPAGVPPAAADAPPAADLPEGLRGGLVYPCTTWCSVGFRNSPRQNALTDFSSNPYPFSRMSPASHIQSAAESDKRFCCYGSAKSAL